MNIPRFLRTIRYLPLRQIYARVQFRLRRVRVGTTPDPKFNLVPNEWQESIRKKVKITGQNSFCLLNSNIEIFDRDDWNNPLRDKLLLYHLHYHDVLNVQKSGVLGFDRTDFVNRWIMDNPPVLGNGWEPYPLSLRIVNWIKWILEGHDCEQIVVESLYLQARALSQQIEFHLRANHLLANAKALYFAGVFFDGPEADGWKRESEALIAAELEEQFLGDGGHFELSPMYHSIATEDILDILNIGRAYGTASFSNLNVLALRALRWLALMTHPDGYLSYFNDATQGIAPTLAELTDYAMRLEIGADFKVINGFYQLHESGYIRIQRGNLALMIDVGKVGPDYQPGHAHCDCLSFELSIAGYRQIVNTGVSTYNVCRRRSVERETSSHSTVSLDECEQSEVWSAFRVGRRAVPVDVRIEEDRVTARHDGFRTANISHRRDFLFEKDAIIIVDKLEGCTLTRGTAHFHFPPNVSPEFCDNTVKSKLFEISFSENADAEIRTYDYCNGFNDRSAAMGLVISFFGELRTKISYENSFHYG